MSSREIEDTHLSLLSKIITDSGLVCIRQGPESEETLLPEAEFKRSDAGALEEATPEPELEETPEETPEPKPTVEEQETIFPSPSLRRLIPESTRAMEAHNRIHVLPETFKTYIDPLAIPKISTTPPQKYIEILAELVGCNMYASSLAEYWFLDTMANLLRRSQDDEMDRPTQAILILWFCEWMKEIQEFDAADRNRMMMRFENNMLTAARFIAENNYIPTPAEAQVHYRAPEEREPANVSLASDKSESVGKPKSLVTFEGTNYECSLIDLTKIIHYIYDLFSTDYQYDLVRSIFTHSPEYTLIEFPYQMQRPKRLYVPLKPQKKKEKKAPSAKPSKKKEIPIPDPPEYIALMEMKAKEELDLEEQQEIEREAWARKSSILPLSFAATDEFFDKYWPPPPPPPEPEPVETSPPSKGKGKKK